MNKIHLKAWCGLCLAMVAPSAKAGAFTANFNDGLTPAEAQLFGNGSTAGVIEITGGVGDTGCLKLTKAVNSVMGSMIINDLDSGVAVNGFTANFKIRIGGGTSTPADGCSFAFASDLPDGAFGEEAAGSGLRISFDIYNNAGEAPAFRIYWGGVQVATSGVRPIAELVTGADFVDVLVRINPTGTLDLTYAGRAIATNLNIGFQPVTGGRFGFGGRTGGANANQFIDDVSITTTQGAYLQPYIVRAPLSARIIAGYTAPLNVLVVDPANSSYQWEKQAPGAGTFTPIATATSASYVSPPLALADAGTQFRVVVSNPGGVTVTSSPATIEVVSLPHATPDTVAYNFDDNLTPPGTNAYGTALATGGFMSLTEAVNGVAGTWIVGDLNSGGPVESIDVAFKVLLSPEPGAAPADGFGFHWAPNLPESGFPNAEEPVGAGLSVGFDVYNNGNNEAPAIDVFWLGTRVGGIAVPGEFLNTAEQFVDVQIRLSAAGLIDVSFNGLVLVYQLQIPNWTAFSGAKYGFAARTGGLNQRQYVDDVRIKSVAYAGPIALVSQPQNATALVGRTATFSVTTNDPARTAYQWQVSSGGGAFTNIPSANAITYTTPVLTVLDEGNQYRVHITSTFNGSMADSTPATLAVVNLTAPASPQIFDRFNDLATVDNQGTVPAAVQTLSGNYVFQTGPVDGFLQLTAQANSEFGTLVIDDFNGNAAVGGFTASVKAQLVGGNPADGWSFSWGNGITPAQVYGGLESGLGNDLRIGFITYAGSGQSIRVNWRGAALANVAVPIELLQTPADTFEEVLIRVTPATSTSDALLDVAQDGVLVIRSLALPGLQGIAGARFAIAARTGGANELHAYDDLAIGTSLYVGPITLASQPPPVLTIVTGNAVTLTVQSSNPPVTSYQWQRAAPGSPTFANVGTNSPTLTTPVLTVVDSGASYRVVCTGPTNVATSTPTVITVVDPALPLTWARTIDFDDGTIPADATLFGSANVAVNGGVGDTGVLELTSAANGLQGSLVLADQGGGALVTGFVSRFLLRVGSAAAGNGTNPPADGGSFVWSPESIPAAFGEGGSGTGLILSFDIYDNDDGNPDNAAGEAPAIEGLWKGESLGNIRVPRSLMESGLDFREVVVRVNPEGSLDVIVGTQVIFWKKPLPGLTPVANTSFGWGGRTGGLNAQQNIESIQYTLFTNSSPLGISEVGPNIVITFQGTLESSTNMSGWIPMVGQTSPLILPKASLTGKTFYRARIPN